jgi:hypothetical protein
MTEEKTMDDWRININEFMNKSVKEAAEIYINMQDEIIIAFCAKYKIMPDKAVLIYQGNKFWVENKTKTDKDNAYEKLLEFAKYAAHEEIEHDLQFSLSEQARKLLKEIGESE